MIGLQDAEVWTTGLFLCCVQTGSPAVAPPHLKWVTGLYFAGVLAHFSHHMVDLPDGSDPSFEALTSAPFEPCVARRFDRTLLDR